MIELEGAEAARATATGMAAVTTAILAPLQGRRPCGGGEGDVRLLPLRGGGSAAALRHRVDAGRRPRSRPVAEGDAAEHQDAASWRARPIRRSTCSTSRAIAEIAHAGGARLIVDNVFATPIWQSPLDARRRRRGLFRHQAHRRPGPLPRRHHPVVGSLHRRAHPQFHAPDRPVDVAVQRLGAAEGAGDAGGARARADRDRGARRRRAGAASEDLAADLSRPRRSSAGRDW